MSFWTKKTRGDMKMAADLKAMHRKNKTLVQKSKFVENSQGQGKWEQYMTWEECRISPRQRHALAMATHKNYNG